MKKMKKEKRDKWFKEEFQKISKEIQGRSSISYKDFLRIRNFKIQNNSTENKENIRKITSLAFNLAQKNKIKESVEQLKKLDGVRIPIASAILAMRFPKRYVIIDRNVLLGLKKRDLCKNRWLKDYTSNSAVYGEYVKLMRKRKPKGMKLRDYERSLFEEGRLKKRKQKK